MTASDSALAFLVKSLLYPVLAVASLVGCAFSFGEPFRGPYFLLAALAFFGTSDLLDVVRLQSPAANGVLLKSMLDVLCGWLVIAGAIWLLLYLSGITDRFDTRVLIAWLVSTPILLWAGQWTLQLALMRHGEKAADVHRIVIVGLNDLGLRLEHTLLRGALGCAQVLGFFEDRNLADDRRVATAGRARVLGHSEDVAEYAIRNHVGVVYVSLPMTRHPRVLTLLDSLRDSTASIYFVLDLLLPNLVHPRFDTVGGIPVMAIRESPFFGVHALVKRVFDIVVSTALIVLVAPLLIAIAVAVRLDSPGPVLFRQRRYGLNGKSIEVLKFRSLKVIEDGAAEYTQVQRGDSRLTATGAFIRRTSLDELPQLFNVFAGSMSLVGPRPHVVAVNEQYRSLIPDYMLRHKIKPGITGLAQVNGCRGGNDLEGMRRRVYYDLEYLRLWSVRLDLEILLRTALVVLKDRGAI